MLLEHKVAEKVHSNYCKYEVSQKEDDKYATNRLDYYITCIHNEPYMVETFKNFEYPSQS